VSAVLRWIAGDDTGTSSKAIWSHMMAGGAQPDGAFGGGHPHDADDFGRCHRLLTIEPAWRARIGEMARYSAEWAALAARWPDLTTMYEAAVAPHDAPIREALVVRTAEWKALTEAIRALLETARVCADCGRVGMTAWTTYPGDVKRCSTCAARHKSPGTETIRVGNSTTTFSHGPVSPASEAGR
jgi:hypothetical protein